MYNGDVKQGFAEFKTIKVHIDDGICHIRFDRPEAKNAISAQLVAECTRALAACGDEISVVVLSGSPEVFCFGADFAEVTQGCAPEYVDFDGPGPMYELWLKLATGPFVTVSYVRGKVNAGGMGFIGASDIVLADETAQFSLSELLFGLYPACVLPFLMRRIGFQKAHFLTLSTLAISSKAAVECGLVDVCEHQGEPLLRRHLMRLRRLSRIALQRYKSYATTLGLPLAAHKDAAVAGNLEVFGDHANRRAISRYLESGLFPWEQ